MVLIFFDSKEFLNYKKTKTEVNKLKEKINK